MQIVVFKNPVGHDFSEVHLSENNIQSNTSYKKIFKTKLHTSSYVYVIFNFRSKCIIYMNYIVEWLTSR